MSACYLDTASRSLIRPEAREAALDFLDHVTSGANPNSLHAAAKHEANVLDGARKEIAGALDRSVRPSEIHFTSGGTEANNIAVLGLAQGARKKDAKKTKVLISAIEHASVLDLVDPLEKNGFSVCKIAVDKNGVVDLDALSRALSPEVALVSVMSANNEFGTVQPIARIAQLAHDEGALVHTDAVQAFLHAKLDVSDVDALSLSAHKIGALEGTGALYLKAKTPFSKSRFGGEQESGVRVGTQNVCGAYVFGRLSSILKENMDAREKATRALRNQLKKGIQGTSITFTVDDTSAPVLSGIASLYAPGIDKDLLVMALDSLGFYLSAGSACTAALPGPSGAVLALGRGNDFANSVIRVSFDERLAPRDMTAFVEALVRSVEEIWSTGRFSCV